MMGGQGGEHVEPGGVGRTGFWLVFEISGDLGEDPILLGLSVQRSEVHYTIRSSNGGEQAGRITPSSFADQQGAHAALAREEAQEEAGCLAARSGEVGLAVQ